MSLTDLLKDSTAPSAPAHLPPGITCEKFVAGPDGKHCVSYLDNGACSHPDEFMCVEWMKHNAHRSSAPTTQTTTVGSTTPTLKEGQLLTREDVESFRKLGVEVELKSPLGTFWLVPARTGKDRMELTPEDAVTLANVVHVFGGRIASLTREGKPLPDAHPDALAAADEPPAVNPSDPSADDAREHLRQLREQTAGRPDGEGPPAASTAAQTSLFGDSKDGGR
jgi:hypothetical protein